MTCEQRPRALGERNAAAAHLPKTVVISLPGSDALGHDEKLEDPRASGSQGILSGPGRYSRPV
jgi:hypothetical protein